MITKKFPFVLFPWQPLLGKRIPVGKKTYTRCLKDVLPRQARNLAKTSNRCPKDVSNTILKDRFVRHLEDTFARFVVDVLQKTF